MANKDFDFNQMINTVRSTINPEYAIPKEKEHHPLNFRIMRMKKLMLDINKQHAAVASELSKLETQLNSVLELAQPYLDEETKVSDEEIKAAEKEDAATKADKSTAEDEKTKATGTDDKKQSVTGMM